MTHSGHERPAFAAMHGPDLLYLARDLWTWGMPHEAARVHHTARQCSANLVARGERAAGGPTASDRRAHRLLQGRPRGATSRHCLAAEAAGVGMGRRP